MLVKVDSAALHGIEGVVVSVNFESTMGRDIAFTLAVLVKNWSCCYAVDPKKIKKKTLDLQRIERFI